MGNYASVELEEVQAKELDENGNFHYRAEWSQ